TPRGRPGRRPSPLAWLSASRAKSRGAATSWGGSRSSTEPATFPPSLVDSQSIRPSSSLFVGRKTRCSSYSSELRPSSLLSDCRLSDTAPLPLVHVETGPVEALRNVGRHRGGDQHLLGSAGGRGQLLAARDIQLGEHVVQDEHRLHAFGAQQLKTAK